MLSVKKNKNSYGATIVEYSILLAVFFGIFLFFGKQLFETANLRANTTQETLSKVVPCSDLGASQYLLGSKIEDRSVCMD